MLDLILNVVNLVDAQKASVEAQLKEKELAVKLKESDDKVKIAKRIKIVMIVKVNNRLYF